MSWKFKSFFTTFSLYPSKPAILAIFIFLLVSTLTVLSTFIIFISKSKHILFHQNLEIWAFSQFIPYKNLLLLINISAWFFRRSFWIHIWYQFCFFLFLISYSPEKPVKVGEIEVELIKRCHGINRFRKAIKPGKYSVQKNDKNSSSVLLFL